MIEFNLPFPPTANTAWRHVGRNVVLAKAQRDYRQQVKAALAEQELRDDDEPAEPLPLPLQGRLAVSLRFVAPTAAKRDLDNLPKAVLDALTLAGIWGNDEQIDCLTLTRADVNPRQTGTRVRIWRYTSEVAL